MSRTFEHGVTLAAIRAIVRTGNSDVDVVIFARGDSWYGQIRNGAEREDILTARGAAKRWRHLTTAVAHMRECGIGQVSVDSENYSPSQRQLIAA